MSERAATWFVTRKYPPRVGGMERLSWEITTRLAKRRRTRVLALRRGPWWLPFFLGYSALVIVVGAVRGRIHVLHIGDPALAPLGRLAKLLDIPVCVTVHGLDVTFPHPLYQFWLRIFLRNFDAYICISAAARSEAIARGVPGSRAHIVGAGVASPRALPASGRDADLLLFVGRLVRRKGLEWFVRAVLPRVAASRGRVRLAIIGAGPERRAILNAAVEAGVAERVEWLGAVSDEERTSWLARAPVCIAPNIHVPGDIEGYGIVVLEAAAAGCAVVAADLEGLRDALTDGEGGRLVASGDADAWSTAITELLEEPQLAANLGERARGWVRTDRDWETVCDRYEAIFDAIRPATRV
jgi:phosphatidyl-myo-inositol dimannoside synthase